MSYVSERGVLSNSRPFWSLSTVKDRIWDVFNVIYLFFRTLIEPATSFGDGQRASSSRNGSGRGPPRPPRGGFRSFSDTVGPPGNFPPMGG